MTTIEFRFTGIVTPDMIRRAAKPVEPIPYKIDTALMDAIKRSAAGRTGPAGFMTQAVREHITDLDTLLLSAVECKNRQQEFVTKTSLVQVDTEVGDMLRQASAFLKSKGYNRMGRGSVLVACALLKADKDKLIPSFKEEQEQLHPEPVPVFHKPAAKGTKSNPNLKPVRRGRPTTKK